MQTISPRSFFSVRRTGPSFTLLAWIPRQVTHGLQQGQVSLTTQCTLQMNGPCGSERVDVTQRRAQDVLVQEGSNSLI